MDILGNLSNQYVASLEMLEKVISACPESLWLDEGYKNRTWHIAYHALFYTHLYLQIDESSFRPWVHHRPDYQFLGSYPWPPHEKPKIGEPYTRAEILDYLQVCQEEMRTTLPLLDMSGSSGFSWLPISKFELQIYNIRHLMQHTGELSERLGTRLGSDVEWVVSDRNKTVGS